MRNLEPTGRMPCVIARGMLALLIATVSVSCVSEKKQRTATLTARHVWPLAPDEPRVAYLRSLSTPDDIGQSPSLLTRVGRWISGDTGESLALQKPFGLALDEAGNLCITDTGANRVIYCDFARRKWRYYEQVGDVQFISPVAVARRGGIFYVADSELAKVMAFQENGKQVWEISNPLLRPSGLALAGNDLAVVDSQAHAVFVFDLHGKLRFQFGNRGTAPGEFNYPTHIAADAQGHLLVTDSMNCRIQVFDLTGKFISEFGREGDTSGSFGRPKGVAVDAFGHVYVADAVFNNIQIFDLAGRLLLTLGQRGGGPGEFSMPGGIAIGPQNDVYVADGYNRRVQIFKYIGPP